MRLVTRLLSLLLPSLLVVSAHAAHTQASLLLGDSTAEPGQTVLAGVRLQMDSGWHTYWKNPGDSGMATRIEWQLPAGVSAGDFEWPAPEKLFDTNLTTYIYQHEVVLLVPLKLAGNLKPGTLNLKASVSWLECDQECVPGAAEIQAQLNIGSQTVPARNASLLARWQKMLPRPAAPLAPVASWKGPAKGDLRPLLISWSAPEGAQQPDFYPDASDQFEVQAPTQPLPGLAGKVRIIKQVNKLSGDWPKEISGLLVQGSGTNREFFKTVLEVAPGNAKTQPQPITSASTPPITRAPGIWRMLAYAFLGGLILNIMPCVLPVISLKILGFVNQAKEDARQVQKLALIYTAGVLVSFLLLAGLVILMQAAGRSVGWGFQFGNPYFLLAMTTLVTLVALNLFGIFEITLSSRALTAASRVSAQHGASGAFFNGLLATILATSCSAPFLGAAVGFAFAQTAGVIVLTLLTVGLGLATPYLVLGWHPAWLSLLPKPGPWMERFKIAMGFPMLGAAVWLCSLLTIHYGERAWWMAVFLIFLAVAAWVYGEFVQRGVRHRVLAGVIALIILGTGFVYAVQSELEWRQPLRGTAQIGQSRETPEGVTWQAWSPKALAQARAENRPVVVDFTAKWCPTCNAIVKPTLESQAVVQKLKSINAVPLLADYTLQPPAITAELRRFGRAGVPLVLVYPKEPSAPPIVFDLVTPSTLLDALDRAGQ